jgi:hypothetical protein
MDDEERTFQPAIRAVLSVEEIAGVAGQSVARTAPADQRMMLAWVLPAMTPADAETLLGRLPPDLASELGAVAAARP